MPDNPAPRKGRIDTATLPVVVRDLWRAQASGTLELENGATTKRIFFRRGDIVFAATNVEYERLGERLVRAGKIKRSVLELAVRVMERSNERFGKTISELGWVSASEIERWVATQIKDIIYSVFAWSSGEYRFEPADEPTPPDLVLQLQTAEVVYEGARRTSDLKVIRAGVGPPSGVLRIADGVRLGIPVTQDEGVILSRVDGRSTILDLVTESPLPEEETLRRIYALLLAGVLVRDDAPKARSRLSRSVPTAAGSGRSQSSEPSEEEKSFRDGLIARHAAMKFGNYYDRLGVDSGASEQKIQQAYEEVMRSLEPDPEFADRLDDVEKRLRDVRARVEEAYRVLADPTHRREYDRGLSGASSEATVAAETLAASPPKPKPKSRGNEGKTLRPPEPPSEKAAREAEIQYAEAHRFWQSGDYFDAVATMTEAVKLDPSQGRYHRVLATWLAENPSCAEAAQEHFELAITLDPGDREAHVGLARLLEQEGQSDRAKLLYDRLASLESSSRSKQELSRR